MHTSVSPSRTYELNLTPHQPVDSVIDYLLYGIGRVILPLPAIVAASVILYHKLVIIHPRLHLFQ
jgi:hypothetical protein